MAIEQPPKVGLDQQTSAQGQRGISSLSKLPGITNMFARCEIANLGMITSTMVRRLVVTQVKAVFVNRSTICRCLRYISNPHQSRSKHSESTLLCRSTRPKGAFVLLLCVALQRN